MPPGVNAPNCAGVPSDMDSVAGTVPPGVVSRPVLLTTYWTDEVVTLAEFLYSKPVTSFSIGHSSAFSYDGKTIVFGWV